MTAPGPGITQTARKLLSRNRRSVRALLCFATLFGLGVAAAEAADPGQEQVTRDFQKSLSLGAGQSFRIENKFGEVRIHGEPGRELKISATIRAQADSREQAQSFADKVRIDVEQTAQGVQVRTNYPEDNRNWFGRKNASYSVDYEIAMPADAPLFVRNSFGSVNASGVRSKSEFDNSHGSLNVRDTGAARLSNSFGSIDLSGAAGDSTISDNNGSVQVSQVKGSLEVRNRFGSITVREIQGAANITGGNGAVNLTDAASANITTSFGSVEARNIRGDLIVHDNNGNVDVSSIGGAAAIADSFGDVTC